MFRPTFALIVMLGWTVGAAAQTNATPPGNVNTVETVQAPTTAPSDQGEKPIAGVGEEGKPTRGFFSAFGHNLVDDTKHIARRNTLYWLGAGIGLAYAVHPADKTFNARLANDHNAFVAGAVIGEMPTILGLGALSYAVGRASDRPRAEHLGLDIIEATALSEGIVEAAKYTIRRERPVQKSGVLPSSGYSMPSGHATLTFASATVLQQHLGYKAGIPTYAIATYVAMSRLHDNVHYLSDVVMGAATGIIIGRSVTWHGRNFYGELQPTAGGVAMVFAKR